MTSELIATTLRLGLNNLTSPHRDGTVTNSQTAQNGKNLTSYEQSTAQNGTDLTLSLNSQTHLKGGFLPSFQQVENFITPPQLRGTSPWNKPMRLPPAKVAHKNPPLRRESVPILAAEPVDNFASPSL